MVWIWVDTDRSFFPSFSFGLNFHFWNHFWVASHFQESPLHSSQIHFWCFQFGCWGVTEWGEALSCYLSSVQFPGTVVRVQFRSAQRSIQCASLCQIQMFYLLKGSNPVLCASLHQFRNAQRSNPMCFTVPNSNVLSSQRIKSSIMCLFALILLFYLFKGSNPG